MNLEITQKSIIYDGKEYAPEVVRVTLTLKNKNRGKHILIPLVLIYLISFLVVISPPVYNILFDYLFLVYGFQWVSFMWLFFLIRNRYFLQFATIQFGKVSKLRLLYSRDRKLLVDRVIAITGNVEYTNS